MSGAGADTTPADTTPADTSEADIGARLFAVVDDAVAAGIDPETALRRQARMLRAAIVAAESGD